MFSFLFFIFGMLVIILKVCVDMDKYDQLKENGYIPKEENDDNHIT